MFNWLIPAAVAEEATVAEVALAIETALTTEKSEPTWLQTAFKKVAELPQAIWGILAALIVLGVVLLVIRKTRTIWTTRMLASAAICIALAFVLSCIRLWKMPQGGSITPGSMLPIFIFAYAFGVGPGMLVGLVYGFLQWMQDGFYMLTPVEAVMDYLLAFSVLGIAGLFRKMPVGGIMLGCLLGTLLRGIVAVTSGVLFFAEYAPEGQPVILYSLGYNGFYLVFEALICVLLISVPSFVPAISRQLKNLGARHR